MGFRSREGCHAELQDAAAVECAGVAGVAGAGTVTCSAVTPYAGGFHLNMLTTPASGVPSTALVAMTQIACDPMEPYTDLSVLFGLGLAAVLGVFLVREFVYRLVMPQ